VISKARITRLGAAGLAALMLVTAGCGDDDDDDAGAPAGGGAGAEQSGDQTGGAGEQAVTDYVDYIGGKAGKADPNESPIYIGWLNQQGGQTEIGAAATDGADLAVKVVNDELGGIDGHPVALKKCFIRNAEEEGTTCGQRLGNDKDVAAITVGGVAIGIQPFYSTIGGKKPVIVGVAVTPVD
jgi:branched-chain amino acid transport system substrate-binding protein